MQMDAGRCGMGPYTPLYHPHHQGNLYGGPEDPSLLARAEMAAMSDFSKAQGYPFGLMKSDSFYPGHAEVSPHQAMGASMGGNGVSGNGRHQFYFSGESMLDQLSAVSMPLSYTPEQHACVPPYSGSPPMYATMYSQPGGGPSCGTSQAMSSGMPSPHNASVSPMPNFPHASHHDLDCDPRELEAFAEHFKQRRIKLGVTQADVGSALGKLKIPGVGSLSQSTICRFESLTLSHNNMIALKPVLQAWLEKAECAARQVSASDDSMDGSIDKKKKRTSITAAEKRSLEAYFAIQPRPSGEKIAQIADKLGLKKGVVRVWFCNQRQKQKRMKFSSTGLPGSQMAQLSR